MLGEVLARPAVPPGRAAGTGWTGPWAEVCEALAARLAEALAGRLPGPAPRVSVLGVRDELAVGAGQDEPATPVHLYGHHAIIGPYPAPAAGGTAAGSRPPAPCARCLARRWQAVRSGPLREALELGGGTRGAGGGRGGGGGGAGGGGG
ncbi:hypothetical protein ACFV4M_42305, partial [Kitasatospora indigofera]